MAKEPIDLGECSGFEFKRPTPADPGEPITIPAAVWVTLTGMVDIPDDSPLWKFPPIAAANAPNN